MAGLVVVFALFVIVAAGAVIGAVLLLKADTVQRAKGDPNAEWAAVYGLHYLREDRMVLRLSQWPPFSGTLSERFTHVTRGYYRGKPLLCYTFRYTTVVDVFVRDRQTERVVSLVAVGVRGSFPVLDVAPLGTQAWLLSKRVEFEHQAFNDRYVVGSPDPRFAYDVIHPRLMEWLMADARALTTGWRLEGPWIMACSEGPLRVAEVPVRADFLHDVIAYMPGHVWPDQ
ncbi:hypothetical protein [Glycomyces sp. NPDC047010]|uniref:hypothetical protein n=1 Tax=Glycomyces sp. NPDC047010 TaxID=3155023 RepID=UPI0033F59013